MTKITLSATMPPTPTPAPPPPMQPAPYNWVAQDPDPIRWMFAGQYCSVEEFAGKIWPDDHEAQLVFLLKYPR